jgi:hypothetical protein
LDAGTVFNWCLEIIEDQSKKDKTKRLVVQIPHVIPTGFVLKVTGSSLHEGPSSKRLVECAFGAAHFYLAMEPDATLERLSRRVAEFMKESGQGEDWCIEGNPREQVDFDFGYQVVPTPRSQVIDIFLKHAKIKAKLSESRIDVSDRMVKHFGFPRGTMFRI